MTHKIEWASEEFDDMLRKREYAYEVEKEKRIIDDMLARITTPEAERYLIGRITGH